MTLGRREGLPDPVQRKGTRRNSAEVARSRAIPNGWAHKSNKDADRGLKDGCSARRERWVSKDMRDVVASRTTEGELRERGSLNTVQIRPKKRAAAVASKAREIATDRAGEEHFL